MGGTGAAGGREMDAGSLVRLLVEEAGG
jgi:hypothetical protein